MLSIIGAGISGLTLAYYLKQKGIDCQIFEAKDYFGGNIETLETPYGYFESGPNTLFSDTVSRKLIEDLGIQESVILPSIGAKNRYILKNNRYYSLSNNPLWFFKSNFLSWKSKLDILKELFKKPNPYQKPTVADFFTYRFNKQITNYLVNPFVRGIYGAKPENLDMEMTFPKFFNYEKNYGSILKGFLKEKKNLERRMTIGFKGGMKTLTLALAKDLTIYLKENIESIEKEKSNYILKSSQGIHKSSKVIFANPANNSAHLLSTLYPEFSKRLSTITYSSILLVHLVFDKGSTNFNFDGFGALHPTKEGKITGGIIWRSSIFKGKKNYILLTAFVLDFKKENSFEKVLASVSQEIQNIYQIKSKPLALYHKFWQQAIPVYNYDLKFMKQNLEILEQDNLYFCTNWFDGISLADCIKKAKCLADKLSFLKS